MEHPAIAVENLSKRFKGRRGSDDVVAANSVSFEVAYGQTLGIVGESGSGKSTVARCLMGLTPPDAGRVLVLGHDIERLSRRELAALRSEFQIVFQEPYESLDPRLKVGHAIAEPLLLHTSLSSEDRRTRVVDLLRLVWLDEALVDRFPHELSGGQQQRVNIARALATEPKVLVLDEPTASLDVSVQAGILRLLLRLQRDLNLTYVMISHDLATIRGVCERVAVMYLGELMEVGPVGAVLANPEHPYTRLLLASELSIDPDRSLPDAMVEGEVVRGDRPCGCVFAPRCPLRIDECTRQKPPLRILDTGHAGACVFSGELEARLGESTVGGPHE